MLNNPMACYQLFKADQRERQQEAERARHIRAATPKQAGLAERMETPPDLTGLVERVIQNVWRRLGLPARVIASRPLPRASGGLPPLSA